MGQLLTKAKPQKREFSIKEFHERRDKILIVREIGGIGDILMHRMMFEDFKKLMPEAEIHFACPKSYHAILKDHPYIDKLIDVRIVDQKDYVISYNTSNACCRYEVAKSPQSGLHRSDIWAGHCGVKLTNHDMHLTVPEEYRQIGKQVVEAIAKGKPVVCLCPKSAMVVKDLTKEQLDAVVEAIQKRDLALLVLHDVPIPYLHEKKIPVIYGQSTLHWLGIMSQVDYVYSVDTGSFHLAGGLGKPLTGVFTFADGKVYGRYYDFILVQKHRDNGDWDCGPCYNWACCVHGKMLPKPCLTEITTEMLVDGLDQMLERWPWDSGNSRTKSVVPLKIATSELH